MFCHKCGTEISSSNASFCASCGEPLLNASPADEHPQDSAFQNTNQESCPTSVNLEFGDNEEALRMSDPIDFLMQEEEEEKKPPPEDITEKNSTDKVKTINDEDMENLIGGAGSGTALDNNQPKENEHKEQPQPRPAETSATAVKTLEQKSEIKEIPPLMEVPPQTDFNDGENIVATAKIKVDETKKNQTDKFQTPISNPKSDFSLYQKPKPRSDQSGLDMAKIKKSSRVAYLSGNSLTLSGGPKISVGDEIRVGENSYEVRLKPKDKNSLYALIGSAVLAIFVTLYFLGAFNSSPYGGLVGMVIGQDDRPLSDQQVRIKETGDEITTNNAGFFIFNELPAGIYTVEYLIDEEIVGEERITVLSDKISTIELSESGSGPLSSVESAPAKTRKTPATEKKTESSSVTASTANKNDPGTVRLTLKPAGVGAYLDGKPMGVGSNTYRVRPGKYLLSVKKRGYKTESKKITVRSGKTLNYSFALKKDSGSERKTDSEIAYENETAGRYEEALKYYEKIIKKNRKDISALLGKARCLAKLSRHDSALDIYTEAGKVAASKGDLEGQYNALSGMIELKPNNFTIYLSRGDLSFSRKDYSRAADDYSKVITLDKRNLKVYYKLGNSYYKDGKYNDALLAFKGAEDVNFADPKAQYYLALTYHALDDHKNTKKAYQEFKKLASYSTAIEFEKDPEWKKVLEYLEVEN